jgi:diadenosine tetraphosphate (Ap4A) HIT family hydrolase
MKKLILLPILLVTLPSCIATGTTNPLCVTTQQHSNEYSITAAGGYTPESLTALFAAAQDVAHKHPSTGYRMTTGIITPSDTQQTALVTLHLSGTPGKVTDVAGGNAACIFCTPTTTILFDDGVVRVIKKPGNRPGTDILIIPTRHMVNIDVLDFNTSADQDLVKHIATIAGKIAQHLKGTDKRYHLMTNAGIYQGVYHLHVHFKADAILDEQGFMQSR